MQRKEEVLNKLKVLEPSEICQTQSTEEFESFNWNKESCVDFDRLFIYSNILPLYSNLFLYVCAVMRAKKL